MVIRSPLINVMVAAAQKAARNLIRDFGEVEQLQVSKKGTADFVNIAERRSENVICRELSKARPNFGFLLEEGGDIPGADTSNRWVINPLDGSTNFLHGIPHFCISIALERDGDFFAGVVYQPIYDELYWAEKGAGAWLNSRRLRVSGRSALAESIFATDISCGALEAHPEIHNQKEAAVTTSAGVRQSGSAALDLAYVAAGRFDGFWEYGLNPWNYGAGMVLVREAGGFASGLDGHPDPHRSGNIVAVNSNLQRSFMALLNTATRPPALAKKA